MEEIDFSGFTSISDIETEIQNRKDTICRKVKIKNQIKDQKKEANKAFNEQIKDIEAEVEHDLDVIDGLNARLRELEIGAEL